jgi:hypothetical protein
MGVLWSGVNTIFNSASQQVFLILERGGDERWGYYLDFV